jgi:sarcosine oxidase, subunit delta
MLQIPCPFCGVRDEPEFAFGGTSHIARPAFAVSDAQWADYLFNRDNPKGMHYERWLHAYGCGRWFNVARDTATDEIKVAYRMTAQKPVLQRSEVLSPVTDPL